MSRRSILRVTTVSIVLATSAAIEQASAHGGGAIHSAVKPGTIVGNPGSPALRLPPPNGWAWGPTGPKPPGPLAPKPPLPTQPGPPAPKPPVPTPPGQMPHGVFIGGVVIAGGEGDLTDAGASCYWVKRKHLTPDGEVIGRVKVCEVIDADHP